MNYEPLILLAEKYLKERDVRFVRPGEIGEVEEGRVEVIFLVPEALDPNMVIDPPDVRVWVYRKTGKVEWIDQM